MSTYQEAIINVEVKEAISKVKAKEATTNVEEKEEISKDEVQVEKTKAETKGHEVFTVFVENIPYEGRRGGGSNHRNICGSLARIRSNQSLGIAKANNQSSLITGQDLLKPVLQGEV
ncbi:hypothetical protein V6N13_029164 [Hibiscus sabdariffa]